MGFLGQSYSTGNWGIIIQTICNLSNKNGFAAPSDSGYKIQIIRGMFLTKLTNDPLRLRFAFYHFKRRLAENKSVWIRHLVSPLFFRRAKFIRNIYCPFTAIKNFTVSLLFCQAVRSIVGGGGFTLTMAMENEQKENNGRIAEIQALLRDSVDQESDIRQFITEIRQYEAITELDEGILNHLIDKIMIGDVKKVNREKVQEVRIFYNFVGEVAEMAA